MQAGAAQIAVHKQRFLAAIGVGDGEMGGDGGFAFAWNGAGDDDGAQAAFEVGEQDGIAQGAHSLFKFGGSRVVSLPVSAL